MYARSLVHDYQRRRARLLGLPECATEMDVYRYIRQGVPLEHMAKLMHEGEIDVDICAQIAQGISLLARLACKQVLSSALPGARLTEDESGRLLRIVHVLIVADALFGSRDKARRWLSKPMMRFSGSSPIEMLSSTKGAGMVEELLIQLADGLVL